MKPLFTLLLSLFTLAATAQVPEANVLSLQVIGGNGDDLTLTPVTATADGGFIISIETSSTIGPIDTLCSIPDPEIIFQKYNSDASVLEWSKCYSADGDTFLIYMFPTADGGNIFGGEYKGSVGDGYYICKQDALGNIVWSHGYSKGNGLLLRDMVSDGDGGYFMYGIAYNIDTNVTIHYGSPFDADLFVLNVDSLGNKIWGKVVGGSEDDEAGMVLATPDGGCYIIGSTASDDYDCTGNHGNTDAYLARLNNNGDILWHNDLGGSEYDGGECAWPDNNGGVIIGGNTNSYDGDVTHYVGGIWALDVDSNGTVIWNNTYGDSGSESPNAICKAIDGTIWIAGVSGTKGGEIDTTYGSTDAWFVHTDNAGNFLDAKVLGSSAQDKGYMIYPLSNGNVIGGGYYSDSGGTFPDIYYGGSDAFLTIFAPWPESVQQISSINGIVKIYPNPADETVTVEAVAKNNYTVIVTDILGRTVYMANLVGEVQIPVSNWQAGIYFVQVISSTLTGY
jgi:hypothetical protein